MNLILYDKSEMDFTSNGIGILRDVTGDEVHEALPRKSELVLQYPVTGPYANYLVRDNYITARPNPLTKPQPFRIYRVNRTIKGWITVYARHAAYRLQTIVCKPFYASGLDAIMQAVKDNAVNECPFTFQTDLDDIPGFELRKPVNIWTFWGSDEGMFLERLSGEIEFDGFTVKILKQRGQDRGVCIRYGKNLKDIEADSTAGSRFNGICPYYADENGDLHYLPENVVMAPTYTEGTEQRIQPVDLSTEVGILGYSEDNLRLAAEAHAALALFDDSEASIKVDFIQMSRTEEYKDQAPPDNIAMGDTVHIVHSGLGVSAAIRVSEIRYQPSTGRYKSITLGAPRGNILKTITNRLR